MNSDVNIIALVKGNERYVWMYHDDRRSAVVNSIHRFASDTELSFTWYDAAVLCKRMREIHGYNEF